ncbi:MAG: LuxR C-terminal-related transcriptional regulator, partial [Chloroflexota bacterium]|nr:LuxR C-terminal-related transcriptional regulator [Chloroflexota bacterium]
HYLTLAETAAGALRGATQTAWLARLEEEHGNFRAVLSRSLAPNDAAVSEGVAAARAMGAGGAACDHDDQIHGDQEDQADLGLRLAGALAPFWRVHGHVSEGLGWLERFLAHGGAADAAVRARALLGAGALGRERARWDGARAWLEAGLTLSLQVQDARLIGQTACALGQVLLDCGAVADARPLLEEGVERLRIAGGPGDLGDALLALATLAEAGGDLRRAIALLEEALATGRREGDGTVVAVALYDLGRLVLFHADGARARALFEEGLQVAEALGSPRLSMKLHRWLGTAASQAGDAALASRHLRASLHLAREHDDQLGVAYSLAALGECALRARDPQAVSLLEDSLRHFTALRHPWGRGRALGGLAAAATVAGDPARALTILGEELAIWRDLDDALGTANSLECVAEALMAQGHTGAAARLYGAAAAQRERLGVAGPEVEPPPPPPGPASSDHSSWRQAWASGRVLALDAAIVMALSLIGAPSAPAPALGGPTLGGPTPVAPPAHLPFDLTPREAEVIRLLAQAASDAEIARQLIVSVRTVNRHVANILGKTEAPNRTAAAALAHRSGLAGAAV